MRRWRGEDLVRGLLEAAHLGRLRERYGDRPVVTAFTFVNGAVTIGLLAALAHVARSPFVFPSLGPTAFLLFHRPLARASSPRSTLLGHLIGVAAGYGSLALFGLLDAGPALGDVTWPRVGAAALSLGATSGAMVVLAAAHPPAGATTLIVSLGLLHRPWELAVLMLAVLLLIVQAQVLNRLAGLAVPLWRTREGERSRARVPTTRGGPPGSGSGSEHRDQVMDHTRSEGTRGRSEGELPNRRAERG